MRKRVKVAVAVLLVTVLGVIVWRGMGEREPVYQGKRLSVWLSEYQWSYPRSPVATRAIRQIGTNAIPTLLKMLCEEDSAFMSKLIGLWGQHVQSRRDLPGWIRTPNWYKNQSSNRKGQAVLGFEILGADAQQAVPALIEIYDQNISTGSQNAVPNALLAIGPAARKMAIPSFLRGAASTNDLVRQVAVGWLKLVHAEPLLVVPALAKSLSDTNWVIRAVAASGLGDFGADAQQAVPALAPLLGDPDVNVRRAATKALLKIDPEAAAKAGVK